MHCYITFSTNSIICVNIEITLTILCVTLFTIRFKLSDLDQFKSYLIFNVIMRIDK